MNGTYQEIVRGECLLRHGPGERHETICARLHHYVAVSLAKITVSRLLPPRTVVELGPGTLLRPDLALRTVATGKVWLIAEVIDSQDHQSDTVTKKAYFEDVRLPRLWMIDPRFDNVEVYHGTQYGLALKDILGRKEVLTEALLPELRLGLAELFEE